MALKPGDVLGSYEILAPLGAGGMGEVYRAVDRDLGRGAAIKVLSTTQLAPTTFRVAGGEVEFEADSDPERLARLEGEAKLLASLNHPNVATLFGLEREEELVFLAMELVSGETLEARIQRRPLSIEEAVEIFLQISRPEVMAGLQAHPSPDFLPDGRTVLFSTFRPPARTSIRAVSLDGGEPVTVLEAATAPRYLETGHLLFAREGDLWVVAFDPALLAVTGNPVRVVEGVLHTAEPHPSTGCRAGHLDLHARRDRPSRSPPVWVGLDGAREAVAADPADWGFPRVSPTAPASRFRARPTPRAACV